jgi:hypothetical protein
MKLEQPVTIKCNDKTISYKYHYELKKNKFRRKRKSYK